MKAGTPAARFGDQVITQPERRERVDRFMRLAGWNSRDKRGAI
jgi:hypothetical protein